MGSRTDYTPCVWKVDHDQSPMEEEKSSKKYSVKFTDLSLQYSETGL